MLRILKIDECPDDHGPADTCPHCNNWITGLQDEISDLDWSPSQGRDQVEIACPGCNRSIGLIREHRYRLTL